MLKAFIKEGCFKEEKGDGRGKGEIFLGKFWGKFSEGTVCSPPPHPQIAKKPFSKYQENLSLQIIKKSLLPKRPPLPNLLFS